MREYLPCPTEMIRMIFLFLTFLILLEFIKTANSENKDEENPSKGERKHSPSPPKLPARITLKSGVERKQIGSIWKREDYHPESDTEPAPSTSGAEPVTKRRDSPTGKPTEKKTKSAKEEPKSADNPQTASKHRQRKPKSEDGPSAPEPESPKDCQDKDESEEPTRPSPPQRMFTSKYTHHSTPKSPRARTPPVLHRIRRLNQSGPSQ